MNELTEPTRRKASHVSRQDERCIDAVVGCRHRFPVKRVIEVAERACWSHWGGGFR
jgi:hypothetical protein